MGSNFRRTYWVGTTTRPGACCYTNGIKWSLEIRDKLVYQMLCKNYGA